MFSPDLETHRLLVRERQAQLRQTARAARVEPLPRAEVVVTPRRRLLRRRLRVA